MTVIQGVMSFIGMVVVVLAVSLWIACKISDYLDGKK